MRARILGTSIFQIALLYLLLMSVTVLALLGFVYWSTASLIERQMSETVQAEIRGLAEQYRNEGLLRLVEVVRERSGRDGDPQNVYLLAGPSLRPLAGNLANWPRKPPGPDGWVEVPLERRGENGRTFHIVRGRTFDLTGGFRLFVGRDTVARGHFRDLVVEALTWALAPAVALGLLGGILIGRYSLGRVEAVRAAGEDIIRGDLSRRVPLAGSGDEFDRLAATINAMLERIETLMGGMRLVTESLAHDLRSPLTRAKSAVESALRSEADSEHQRQALEQTSAEIETILRTSDSLINIAQAEAGVNRLSLATLDLSALAGDLVEVYQPIAEDTGLALESEILAGVTLDGHRQLLGQAIANLLDNAVKFTPAGGRVTVTLARETGQAVLTVTDTGPGVAPEDRARVLERFVRLDDSRGTPGSGLGLSLVAAVAKLHGARLELSDNAPGLRVELRFPPS